MSVMSESTVNYFSDYLERRGDPLTSTFPGMSSPWFFFLLSLKLSLMIKLIIPAIMANRKAVDIRPWSIISSGFGFGTTTVSMFVILSFTPAWSMTTKCNSYKNQTNDLIEIVYKYIAYCFIYCKIYDFIKPILSALAKKEDVISNLSLLQLNACVMFCWIGAKINPGGVFILFGLLDTIYQIFMYGYLVFAGATSEMKPKYQTRLAMKTFIRYYRWITAAFAVPYNIYFLLQSNCPNFDIGLVSVIYIALYVILFPIDVRARQEKERIRSKLE